LAYFIVEVEDDWLASRFSGSSTRRVRSGIRNGIRNRVRNGIRFNAAISPWYTTVRFWFRVRNDWVRHRIRHRVRHRVRNDRVLTAHRTVDFSITPFIADASLVVIFHIDRVICLCRHNIALVRISILFNEVLGD